MPGIVTSTGITVGSSVKTYTAQFTSTSTSLAINLVTGTTATSTSNAVAADKGIMLTFQNLSTAANVYIGGSDVSPTIGIVIGAATTVSTNVSNTYVVFSPTGSNSGIQMNDWYVCATTSAAKVVGQLLKPV